MTQWIFDIPDGSIGEARRDDGATASVIRFGFVAGASDAEPAASGDSDVARLLARGIFGLDPRISLQNLERQRAYCPLCKAPVVVRQDGRTRPWSPDDEVRALREARTMDPGHTTILPDGELWITVEGYRPRVAPLLVVHYIAFHGYRAPAGTLDPLTPQARRQTKGPQE
jgi:hypothetical protein